MPGKAVSSKLLAQRWDEEAYRLHLDRMKNASSTLDTEAPKKYPHLLLSLKKLLIEEERQARYHNENKVLMDKIRDIVKGRGTLDQRNDVEKKSLNTPYMAKMRERIRKENLLMLRRLKGVVSTMTHTQYEGDFQRHLNYKDMLSHTTKDYKHRLPPIWRDAKVESKAEEKAARSADDSRPAVLGHIEEKGNHLQDKAQQKGPLKVATSEGEGRGADADLKSVEVRGDAESTEKEKGESPEVERRSKGASESLDKSAVSPKKPAAQIRRKKKVKVKAAAAAQPTAAPDVEGEDEDAADSSMGKHRGGTTKREPTETSFLPRIDDKSGLVSRKKETADDDARDDV